MLFLKAAFLAGQLPEISMKWEEEIVGKFETASIDDYTSYDYSAILSNQMRFEGDPWSTYIGVFGPNHRRIDFLITAEKVNDMTYAINGKSKLGSNIRELTGKIRIRRILHTKWIPLILLFDYELKEPGDKNGDGVFVGIGSVLFTLKEGKPKLFWSESGDFRTYNNMFVGVWNRYNSDVSRECIFTFNPSGTYTQLPFREYLYKDFKKEDECKCYYEIKDEFRKYGWKNYDDSNSKKENWWK